MKRKPHTPDEKAKIVLEVLKGERTLNEIASENDIHPNMLSKWKKEAIAGLPSVFENGAAKKRKEQKEQDAQLQELYAQIGKLTTQVEWLKKNLVCELSVPQRRLLVDFEDKNVPVSEQANPLDINRTSLYYNLKVVKYILKTSVDVYPKLLQIKCIARGNLRGPSAILHLCRHINTFNCVKPLKLKIQRCVA